MRQRTKENQQEEWWNYPPLQCTLHRSFHRCPMALIFNSPFIIIPISNGIEFGHLNRPWRGDREIEQWDKELGKISRERGRSICPTAHCIDRFIDAQWLWYSTHLSLWYQYAMESNLDTWTGRGAAIEHRWWCWWFVGCVVCKSSVQGYLSKVKYK